MVLVLLATCADLPSGDEDGPILDAALRRNGAEPRWAVWNDHAQDWAADLVVIRSTWDYTSDRDGYLAWAHTVPRLVNGSKIVEWNSDKVYLRELAQAGVPVVPTSWAAPGEPVTLPDDVAEFVVKPSVGAGSRGAGRFPAAAVGAAREHADELHGAGRTVMVQPYVAGVDATGERALIYVDGEFSHAVTKMALLPAATVYRLHDRALYAEETIVAATASEAELAAGARTIDYVTGKFGRPPLYARVDLLPADEGPVLVELELTEPSLFLGYADGAAERFAAAIVRRAEEFT